MRKIFLLGAIALFACRTTNACTNFLAGKNATTDGSTLITYSADSYYLFGALYHYPAATYPTGTMRDINEWDTGKFLGKIPQTEKTYAVIGNMNEHQLAIGETTFGGREELVDTTGVIDYGSLIYIALQRAATAREAIKTMTELVAKYGYYSSGESFSIADPNEVWILELIGKGNGYKGAVWVAMRLPDDCVSAHANQARITTFPQETKRLKSYKTISSKNIGHLFRPEVECVYSEDVISFARSKGYYHGTDADFSFSDVYNPLDYSGIRACEARVWTFFRQLDPDMDRYITYIRGESPERMPLWIKPVKKVSAQDLKNYMRDQFEGTELDMTQGFGAGPFNSKLRHSPLTFEIDGQQYIHERPVATQQTGFTFVAQMRNWLPNHIGGIFWFGVDDAATSVYVPVYCSINKVPHCYDINNGSLLKYSPSAAFWVFNTVAQQAYAKSSFMSKDIRKVIDQWENTFNSLVPSIDSSALKMNETEARIFLTDYSSTQAQNTVEAWKELNIYLLVKYLDGNVKREENGKFLQNEAGIPENILRPGYPEEFLREMIKKEPKLRQKTKEELKQNGFKFDL
jgi:dipeptidase